MIKEPCNNKECPYANMDIDENDLAGLFEKFCACLDCEESELSEQSLNYNYMFNI